MALVTPQTMVFPVESTVIPLGCAYWFPSPDSDWDLRGVHVLPAEQVIGLMPLNETLQVEQNDEIELDLVTHDIRKFFQLLLRPNGYVLEQLLSPIMVHTTPEHEEVKALTPATLTRHHAHYYLGFADSQWRLFRKEEQPRIKPLLYTFRVLLTGVHLMRTGMIEANLGILHEIYPLPFVPDLMARKLEGAEQQTLAPGEVALHESLAKEVAQFGIKVTMIEPGAYATEFGKSATRADPLEVYDTFRRDFMAGFMKLERGNPKATTEALFRVVDAEQPPLRLILGNTTLPQIRATYADRLATWDAWQAVSNAAQ